MIKNGKRKEICWTTGYLVIHDHVEDFLSGIFNLQSPLDPAASRFGRGSQLVLVDPSLVPADGGGRHAGRSRVVDGGAEPDLGVSLQPAHVGALYP